MTDYFLEFYTLVRFCDIEDQGKKRMEPAIFMCDVSLKDYSFFFFWLHIWLFSLILFCNKWLYFLTKQIIPPI